MQFKLRHAAPPPRDARNDRQRFRWGWAGNVNAPAMAGGCDSQNGWGELRPTDTARLSLIFAALVCGEFAVGPAGLRMVCRR